MPETKRRSTGIPKIDRQVAEFLKLPKREAIEIKRLDEDFPGCKIGEPKSEDSTVIVIGAGWEFPAAATALVAAGARVVAYELSPEKMGLGQIGLTRENEHIEYGNIWNGTGFLPAFTPAQLKRLPSVITTITKDDTYKALMRKRNAAIEIREKTIGKFLEGKKKYAELGHSYKISKREVIEVKKIILKLLQAAGAVQIIYQGVTIDMMQSWLEAQKPVVMASGMQVNLKAMGLDHLDATPGFVKEFRLKSPATETLLDTISKKQHDISEKHTSSATLPRVAFIGGGPIAMNSALDLLERVKPDLLEIVWIRPEEKKAHNTVEKAQRAMKYRWIRGYISDLVLSEDERTIKSVKAVSLGKSKAQDIRCDLLIHTWNEKNTCKEDMEAIWKEIDSITMVLDEKKPSNGLVRDRSIIPTTDAMDLVARITKPWTASLEDDEVLKTQIQELVKRQTHEDVAMVVSGDNLMVDRVVFLAASLGYHGSCLQIAVPALDPAVMEREAKLKESKNACALWHDVKGRLIGSQTVFRDGKFSLGVLDPNGEKVQLPEVDAIINGAGKTTKTPLVTAMIERGYIGETPGRAGFYSKCPKLSGIRGFLGKSWAPVEVVSPSVTFEPYELVTRLTDPFGWQDMFEFAQQALSQQ
jgi:hypothetical protein